MDAYQLKQQFSEMVDHIDDVAQQKHTHPFVAQHYANSHIELPSALASQLFLLGDTAKIYINNYQPLNLGQYTISGTSFTCVESITNLTVHTHEARWEWDVISERWWLSGLNPDTFYELQDRLCAP